MTSQISILRVAEDLFSENKFPIALIIMQNVTSGHLSPTQHLISPPHMLNFPHEKNFRLNDFM